MNKDTYTKREIAIIRTKRQLPVILEEFVCIYHKAFYRNQMHIVEHLKCMYPEFWKRTNEIEDMTDNYEPADKEYQYQYPILMDTTRNTEKRILNTVSYLTGVLKVPREFVDMLRNTIAYHTVLNFDMNEYVRVYSSSALWGDFYRKHETLNRVLKSRSIKTLDELFFRSVNYFENYIKKSSESVL